MSENSKSSKILSDNQMADRFLADNTDADRENAFRDILYKKDDKDDFYETKNWYVGKNKMVNWKAAVRTWEQRSLYWS